MNERIRELAKQLGPDPVATIGNWGRVEWADNIYPQLGDRMYAAVDLEKFAELLIRKCAQVSEDDITDGDACCTNTAYRISRQIKKHFGVEE